MYNSIIVIGIFLSLIYSEFTGLSTMGLIVPGYIALNLNNLPKIFATFGLSFLVYLSIRLLSKKMIIYGRRQFAICIGLGMIYNLFLNMGILSTIGVIGNIVPGLIANEWLKSGFIKPIISLLIIVFMLALIMAYCNMKVF